MISKQPHRIVATTSARSARFGTDAEPGPRPTVCTPMLKTGRPRRGTTIAPPDATSMRR
jgi:hypothetical protein